MSLSRLVAPFLLLVSSSVCLRAAEPFRYPEGKHAKGELKYVNGLPVLTLEGKSDEIGAQMGVLGLKPAVRLLDYPKDYLKLDRLEFLWPALVFAGKAMVPQFPADQRRELEAAARASAVDRDLLVVANTMFDIQKVGACSSLFLSADRSATGAPLLGRNLDYPTLGYLQEYSLVMVVRPEGKHAFVSVGFPGFVGCLSGMNDAGLSVATLEVYSSKDGAAKFDPQGIPYAMCYRRVLEECKTVEEAEKLLRSMKRTTLNNLAVCDRNGGAVFEITPRSIVVRRPVGGICACTNHFCCKELATSTVCRRFERLEKCCTKATLSLPDLARGLHAANRGEETFQTMIFEPAALKLHLAIGKCPSSALPLKPLELGPLLGRKEGKP